MRAGRPGGPTQEARRAGRPCPPNLTGGESPDEGAKVDWLTCTWLPERDEHVAATTHAWLTQWLGGVMGESVNGLFGYQEGVRFYVPIMGVPVHVARVDFGGEHKGGRARLDLSGAGCSRVRNWHALRAVLEGLTDSTLTRVDLAVDALEGEYSVDDAAAWYQAGEFNAGGRMPRHSTVGDWLSEESRHGRTLEVGRRENGKMLRCYEKGKQLGDQDSRWVRFEVELRNNDRDLPFDMLTRCDEYFVGAYRCLERLLSAAGEKIKTHQKEGQIALQVMQDYAKSAYGQLLHVMRVQGLSASEVIDELARPGIPRRLERASLAGFLNGGSTPPVH